MVWLNLLCHLLGIKTLEEFFYLILGLQYPCSFQGSFDHWACTWYLSHGVSGHWSSLVARVLTSIECTFIFIRLILLHGIVGLRPCSL